MTHFNTSRFKDAAAIWQSAVKSRSRLSAWLSRAIPIIAGSNSLSWVKAGAYFSTFAFRIYRTQGSRGLALYLKAANLLLIRASAGKGLENSRDAGVAVSTTSTGLPRCIVPVHRSRIRNGEGAVIRLWLGFFTLYRVLAFRGRLSLTSIVKPGVDLSHQTKAGFRLFLGRFMTYLGRMGISPLRTELTNTDLLDRTQFDREKSYWYFPDLEGTRRVLLTSGPSSGQGVGGSNIIGHGLDVWNWVNSVHYPLLHGICLMTGNIHFLNSEPFTLARESQILVSQGKAPWMRYAVKSGTEGLLGSLSIREEPGKLRIFAMVDSLTQWVLYPLHKALFSRLSKIPQDGTFNQTAPVERLLSRMEDEGLEHVWSYDLSAATDRIPVLLQEYLLALLTSIPFAATWSAFLTSRAYRVPRIFLTTFGKKGWKADPLLRSQEMFGAVRYAVGQPMGAYSSWAMLAFIHHALVQFAAYRAGFRAWFPYYAVLGDDVVIAHREVANQYVLLMTEIGVDIGFHKSVISNNRSLEFAKRFYFKGKEVTPLPLLGIATGWLGVSLVPEVISVVERITGKVLSSFQIAKYIGCGFRGASGADNKALWLLPKKLRSTLILLLRPGAPRGAANLWDWLRAKTLRGITLCPPKSVDALGKYLVKWASEERLPRLLKLLEVNLNKFIPGQSFEVNEEMFSRYATWFDLYITQPLKQDFMVQRMNVEGLLRKIRPFYLSSDKAITDLLTELEEFEREITAIPKEVVRHKSQLAETSVPLLPNLVRKWTDLGRFLARTSSQTKRLAKRVTRGEGASPLMRTK
jgi:hypothetical protein